MFMRNKKVSIGMTAVLAAVAVCLFMTGARAAAQTETVLYGFGSSTTYAYGDNPFSNLIFDAAGNLYSTTSGGGANPDAYGTVFELSPSGGGSWTPKVLADFGVSSGSPNGGVIFDAAGNLYGVTVGGGAYQGGVVYELMPQAGGGWTEKWLHQFGQGTDGKAAIGNLAFDSAGNLYGVTIQGGTYGQGTVYELIPQAGGLWAEKILHNFSNTGADGASPEAGVILDSSGNVYGTTLSGGANKGHTGGSYAGTVFELMPAGGEWTEKILYSFPQSRYDAAGPFASLIFDAAGNLYGTTSSGGQYFSNGTVFELSPNAGGTWTETILHSFGYDSSDGVGPYGNLIMDSTGSLYGTTSQGGKYGCLCSFIGGTVFKLTPGSGGTWTERILHNFGNGDDAAYPLAGLVMDASGNLYGTSRFGGGGSGGVGTGPGAVFEISR
jgi:uncharacterized repeat protein (TIGR03803 family)